LSQIEQCDALGGRNILQVKQYFSFIVWFLMTISFVLGGGRYAVPLPTTVWTSICLSISAASSFVALGRMPGSLKLVLKRFDITKMKRTPAITGTAGLTCFGAWVNYIWRCYLFKQADDSRQSLSSCQCWTSQALGKVLSLAISWCWKWPYFSFFGDSIMISVTWMMMISDDLRGKGLVQVIIPDKTQSSRLGSNLI